MNATYFSKRVFVVDDTSFMRGSLIKILDSLGFDKGKITEFPNGRLALEKLSKAECQCDIILCDWNMPEMTGLELLKSVRTTGSKFKSIPFVLITTESEKEKVIEAIQYRLNGYILKPVDIETLKEKLDSIFSTEGSENE